MRTLSSYLQDRWVEGSGPATDLHNAATGAVCAQVRPTGFDLGAALQHARAVGGPSLRAMSFAERGALLKRLAGAIHAARDELIELGRENSGNTRGDAKFDVDGASGTLAWYASLGASLGDATLLRDGEAQKVLRSARFVGQHLLVPRRGVAIHINAFNFPAWGMCEKLAVAVLAGVPVLTKPGTATALVAHRIVELWVEQGLLPAGVLSLLVGSAADLLDHVGPQDCVAFTGSGATGAAVRGHPRVVAMNVPVNVEADSLNAAVLGPDVEVGSDTFQMFLADVVRDLTQKAGQKCTAIRRILVPERVEAEVIEAITERLADARLGDPAEKDTAVGPLASAAQQRDVRAGRAQLGEAAECVWRSEQAEPEHGYYVAPRLYRTRAGKHASFVHEHEVFGPVATVLTWSGDADEAVEIVAAGGGGLVTSLYTDDEAFGGALILGLAPWHGRLMWGSRKVFDQSPGPGTVLPDLVHGGPGKAGGGEELGGARGLRFYLQRTAVQADRVLLERLLAQSAALPS